MQNRFVGNNHPPFAQIRQDASENNDFGSDRVSAGSEFVRVFFAFPYHMDNDRDELEIMFSAPLVWLNAEQIEFVEEYSFTYEASQYPLSKIITSSGHIFYIPDSWRNRDIWSEQKYLNNHPNDIQTQIPNGSINIDIQFLNDLVNGSNDQVHNKISVDTDDFSEDDSYDSPPEMFPSDEDTGFFIPDT